MLYISYRFSSCKLHCRHATYIYWYSTVTHGDWGVVLFFIALTNLFVFTNQLIFLFPSSVHTVFNYMCVCVWAGERKGLLLCSVMTAVTVPSKNCLGTAVCCESCITEIKQAVHAVYVQSGLLELDQLVKMFIVFYQIWCVTEVILWLCIDQIKFRPLVISAISLMSISILSLSIFKRNSAALYALSNISELSYFPQSHT